jgi:hypothetical protein
MRVVLPVLRVMVVELSLAHRFIVALAAASACVEQIKH